MHELVKPSQVHDELWVWAERLRGDGPALTERSGKWLVYVGLAYLDNAWELVRTATEDGRLGPLSKASTAMPSEYAPGSAVVCVYTYDWADEADVMRVREDLRSRCAVKRTIAYKTDEDTLAGNYGAGLAKYRA